MTPPSALLVHNYYQQPGGEDQVFAMESAALRERGHRIVEYTDHNRRIASAAASGIATIWNLRSYARIRELAVSTRPEIAHFHNTFPLISPSAYYAMRELQIPVVQKLSNFRLVCPGGLLLRNGGPCEDCIDKRSLRPAIAHRCYRGSWAGTAAVSCMLAVHRSARTWQHMVDIYVALSHFAREKFIRGGLPEDRVVVKTNFVSPDPQPGEGRGGFALYVGRLSQEKGICTLVEAWSRLPEIPLKVVGEGPEAKQEWPPNVTLLGFQPRERVFDLMRQASVLIFPSICYENAPVTILEAYACGLPVIATNIGSIPEFVTPERTGLLFAAANTEELVHRVRWLFANPAALRKMRVLARAEYESKYTADRNYSHLLDIYAMAREHANRRRRAKR